MKKMLIGIMLLSFLVGCGHPVAIGLAIWLAQPHDGDVVYVAQGLTITKTSLPYALNGVPYNEAVDTAGGTPPYAWSITAGALPSAITIDPLTGDLTGTPGDAVGDFTFTVEVTDSATPSATATRDLTITLYDQLLITDPSPLPDAIKDQVYGPVTIAATGGTGNTTWSITAGSLPTGLSIDANSGEISGTPTAAAGPYGFTVTVEDDANPPQTDTLDLTLNLYENIVITTASLPDAVVNLPYSLQLSTTGGSTDLAWSLTGGPASLSIDAATGVISGTPPAGHAGSYTFTVDVTDNVTGATDSRDYPVDVLLVLRIATATLPDSYVGATYNQTVTAVNGVPAYTWSWTGTTPSGLNIAAASGDITGTPDTAGDYTFTVEVLDSDTPAATDTKDFTIHIYEDLLITTATLPDGDVGTLYSAQVAATGGTGDFAWSLSGAPASITIDAATGVISGTPVLGDEGAYTFTVDVTDNVTGDTDSQDFPVDIILTLYITTASLPDSYVTGTYNETLTAAGGVTPYTWSLSGTLPSGLSLATATGVISGTPDTAGDYTFTVEVLDSDTPAATDSTGFTIHIDEELQITTTSPLPYAINGIAYSETLSATGGTGPYTWSEAGGALPTGLSLNSGVIEGTPADTANPYSVTVQVDDNGTPAQTDTLALSIQLYDQLQITTSSPLPNAALGSSYNEATLAATGGTGSYTWSEVTSELATYGLTLNADGTITGTPSLEGTCTFTAEVQDDASPAQTAQGAFRITIEELFIADFTATPTTGVAPLEVYFTNSSLGTVTSWEWDFGDGPLDSTNWDTSHTYANPGWYTVKLTINNATTTDICTKVKHILVYEAIWYVDDTGGNDANGGTSWADAFATIQAGLDEAAIVTGDYDLVLVADGTYTGVDNRNLDFAGEDIYLKTEDYYSTATWIIDCEDTNNTRGLLFNDAEGSDSVVDGFTIQNGRFNPGGGISCIGASPTIKNCTIDSNRSTAGGGDRGGGIALNNASPMIINCTISNNNTGGGGGDNGGGIYCINGSDPTITDCAITGNTAGGDGGGIYCDNSSPTIVNCAIENNTTAGGDGGGIYCTNGATPVITTCTVTDNQADASGGGIHLTGGTTSAAIANCLIANNSNGTSGFDLGGGICCEVGASATIADCTVANNTADYGGGLYCSGGSTATAENTIFWGNTAGTGNQIRVTGFGTAVTLNYCDYADGANDVEVAAGGAVNPDANCITSDPVFVDAGVAGVGGGGDYHLQGTSLCIDAGDNTAIPVGVTTDLDGNARIINTTVDMGAYEYQ